jgi:NADH dehydrogenase
MADLPHVVVLGGSGFVGRHVVARLAGGAYRVTVVARRRAAARSLLPLPTVQVVEADPHDPAALARVAHGAFVLVNIVGILHERGRDTFQRVHVDLARTVVAACRSAGVARLLHMSAINADPAGPSRYLRSKGEAEAIVSDSGLAWTMFRPSVIFGPGDSFLGLFAKLLRVLPLVVLAAPRARFQPVYVGDVAHCFAHALDDKRTIGQRYDLCGPKVYTLRELVAYVGETIGHPRPIVPLGPALSKLQATMLEWTPGPLMTRDNLASMQKDAVSSDAFPAVFGIEPVALEAIAPTYLAPGATHSKYDPLRAHGGR